MVLDALTKGGRCPVRGPRARPLCLCGGAGRNILLLVSLGPLGLQGMDPELTSAVKSEDTVTDERVGLFTPDKGRCTADGMGRAAVIAARRGTVCGEVGRVLRFRQLTVHTL